MRILGVDPGSRMCGYGVIEVGAQGPGACAYVECGVLSATRGAPMEQRLGEIACWLTDVVTELRPLVVAVEDVFTHQNVRSALALAQARGTVLAVAGMAGLPVYSYAPAVVKKTVTGRGRAPKEQVALMVQALVGLRRVPEADAADALAVAITHAQRGPTIALGSEVTR
ncbi:crossover junction endodeoxyribonuclease RuvC [Haliangium ochraceum]|uniref:Crossover junction endodeoxyribonuclease RuvC n=1 Tax=Haliangium ochraceum (strain DSM 14365 / JCM 11303 / SMP-2) TaxID=502025 RepID=D0LZE7_HALO1|nr:crossover junction endodeoxyribonuclease RuvC [Haliangium ochraceum]ACY16409.1 crossover junction endodeoxyribonuclease RuvC [Haliangium ochraceum DSM 14365]